MDSGGYRSTKKIMPIFTQNPAMTHQYKICACSVTLCANPLIDIKKVKIFLQYNHTTK